MRRSRKFCQMGGGGGGPTWTTCILVDEGMGEDPSTAKKRAIVDPKAKRAVPMMAQH